MSTYWNREDYSTGTRITANFARQCPTLPHGNETWGTRSKRCAPTRALLGVAACSASSIGKLYLARPGFSSRTGHRFCYPRTVRAPLPSAAFVSRTVTKKTTNPIVPPRQQ